MRILVTGAGGLIGGALVKRLRAAHEVSAITRSAAASFGPGVRAITADLAAPELPRDLPEADAVVHLAQSPHYREFPARADDIFNVNVASTVRLLDWSRRIGVAHFILASTGNVDSDVRSYYTVSKQSAERFAQCYAESFAVLILRFHFVYGPGQRDSMLIPRMISNVRASVPIPLAGNDGARFNPTYVDDAVGAIEAGLKQRTAGTVAIAGPEVVSIRQMAQTIGAAVGTPPMFAVDPAKAPQDLIGDINDMSTKLAAPTWSFASGIAELVR